MKRLTILLVLLAMFKFALPQGGVVEFIKAGTHDAEVLFEPYLNPYAMALGEGLNNGWFYTAETHKRFGFDISLNISAVNIPESDQFFDLSTLPLTNSELVNPGGNTMTPTAAGSSDNRPELLAYRYVDVNGDGNKTRENLFTYRVPDGAGISVIPVPMAQVSFGLLPHTDVVVRYVPKLKFSNDEDEVSVGLTGGGVKHNFKEWIPFLKHLPFDASLFFTYAKISAESGLQFSSADYGNITVPPGVVVIDEYSDEFGYGNPDPDQRLEFNTKAIKYGLIVSKKVSIITVFGSVASTTTESNVDLLGAYPILEEDFGASQVVVSSLRDPLKLDMGKSSNIALNAGFRLKLAFFKIFASINKAEYTSYNAGIALGYR